LWDARKGEEENEVLRVSVCLFEKTKRYIQGGIEGADGRSGGCGAQFDDEDWQEEMRTAIS